jgi:hypothetical protein
VIDAVALAVLTRHPVALWPFVATVDPCSGCEEYCPTGAADQLCACGFAAGQLR